MTDSGIHNTEDMYNFFVKLYPTTSIREGEYKKVVNECYKFIVDTILEGNTVKLGQRLGEVRIQKHKRTYKKPRINWAETMILKKQGIKKLVYYTDDWWFKWYWKKNSCQIPNKTVYSFTPTKGPNGIKAKLAKKLKSDEFSYLIYSE